MDGALLLLFLPVVTLTLAETHTHQHTQSQSGRWGLRKLQVFNYYILTRLYYILHVNT